MQPQREEDTLIVFHPAPETINCTEVRCFHKYKAATWSYSRQSLTRHLEKDHEIVIVNHTNMCSRCNADIGVKPTLHKCGAAAALVPEPPPPEHHPHECEQCGDSFPSRTGLKNHKAMHKRESIRNNTNNTPATNPTPSGSERRRPSASARRQSATPTVQQDVSGSLSLQPSTPWGTLVRTTSPSLLSIANQSQGQHESTAPPTNQGETPSAPPPPRRPTNLAAFVFSSTPTSPEPPVTAAVPTSLPSSPSSADIGETAEQNDDDVFIGDNEQLNNNNVSPAEPNHINSKDESVIHVFEPQLKEIEDEPKSNENWTEFNRVLEEITTAARVELKIEPRDETKPREIVQVEDCKYMQKLYRRNRRRAIRLITEGESTPCPVPPPEIEEFFRARRAPKTMDPDFYSIGDQTHPVNVRRFTKMEVALRLRKFENTAPGEDQLTYNHWRSLDPSCTVLTRICNICLKYRKIPAAWKNSRTILIHKKGNPSNLSNWRPISILRTLYKLYSGLLTTRVCSWLQENDILAHAQKGFMPFDGVFEHNFTLQRYMKNATTSKKDIFIAWLDFADAFGSIPHSAPAAALTHYGAGDVICEIVNDMYNNATTAFMTPLGETNPIHVQSGVHQGDPLSGILFNIVINPILERAAGNSEGRHKILAFADDVTPIAEAQDELQQRINIICHESSRLSIQPNANKCVSLHLSGQAPVGTRPTEFTVNGQIIKNLGDGEAAMYLGKPTGYMCVPPDSSIQQYIDFGVRILQSRLSPWQKLDAMKTFFYSSLVFPMRTAQFGKTEWRKVDEALRPHIKRILYLPKGASNEYIYGGTKGGACNMPIAAEDSDIFHVDGAFKLLTSIDPVVAEEAADDLWATVRARLGYDPSQDDVNKYLSGYNEGEMRRRPNATQNVWTLARVASTRLNITWEINNNPTQIKLGEISITPKHRRIVAKTIRNYLRMQRDVTLQSKPNQGKAMECVAESSASHSFIRTGAFVRFADWRFIHRARLNLVPLNGQPWRPANDSKQCRRCGNPNETLPHVLGHCMRYSRAYTLRHDAIVSRIKKAAEKEFRVVGENTEVDNSHLRPDLVLCKGRDAYIIDVTIPFENRKEAMEEAALLKTQKYTELAERLKQQYHYKTAVVVPFLVGALGSWYPGNDVFMKKLCSKAYASLMRKLCVTDAIRWSRDIYIEHITGKQQYTIQ
ncbi:unnamed protein product [Orchesella dallaii]|uniref:Retrovirus-related Pol polyprotein from type-1 retrotransposable element R2 n=1 Tax=Orchesella dallaii TaxID=48710 RepID=A0ABP1PIC6_9HEXA